MEQRIYFLFVSYETNSAQQSYDLHTDLLFDNTIKPKVEVNVIKRESKFELNKTGDVRIT